MLQHVFLIFLIVREISRRVVGLAFFPKIVFDHLRHEIVYALVIRYSVARSIDYGDIALAHRLEDPRHTDE